MASKPLQISCGQIGGRFAMLAESRSGHFWTMQSPGMNYGLLLIYTLSHEWGLLF